MSSSFKSKNQLNNYYGSFERSGTIFSTIRRVILLLYDVMFLVGKNLAQTNRKI